MQIPDYFCWTRFGTETGEKIDSILNRKEGERIKNNGIFLWGIGNAIGPSIKKLIKLTREPDVIFSPIKSKPKQIDAKPLTKVIWKSGITINGERYIVPKHSIVTSRLNSRGFHYALVCYAENKLEIANMDGRIYSENLQNILTGNKVGASQVTAVVKNDKNGNQETKNTYNIAFKAKLVYPYFIKLSEPLLTDENNLFSQESLGLFEDDFVKYKSIA